MINASPDVVSDAVAEQFRDIVGSGEQLQTAMGGGVSDKIVQLQQQLIEKLGGHNHQLNPKALEIAKALTVQPQLIPAVDGFLKRVSSELNAAVAEVLAKHLPPEPAEPTDTTE